MNKISASSVLVGARTHIELTWPNGPMVAVGHARHNNKSIHCLNHSGGDNHRERAAPLRYTDGRPPDAGKIDISMGNAQEGVWLLVISLSYPRQTLSNICQGSGLRRGLGNAGKICRFFS